MTPSRNPLVWLLDFDGTLARLEPVVDWPAVRLEVRALLERAGAPPEVTGLTPPRALGMYDAYRAHLESEGAAARKRSSATLRKASALIEKHEVEDVDRAEPLPGALDLLRAISAAKLQSAIVTSNSSAAVKRWMRRHRIGDRNEVIVGRDSGLALKPDPASVVYALELLGAAAEDAVLVGDSEADLRAALASRVRFIGIASQGRAHDSLVAAGAEEIYASPAALAIHRSPALAPGGLSSKT